MVWQSEEHERLNQAKPDEDLFPWYRFGPYVSERSWGTVREDYSNNGDAWEYFSYKMAPSRVYRWGEDGIAGVCDRYQIMALTFAFWNGQDKILKERLFGVNPHEANHGEDVKEYYYYLDNTPTHSYMKYLYKYPQAEFPTDLLVQENRRRNSFDREFELCDTGVFHEGRYFDIFIEYAKNTPDDLCIKLQIINRAQHEAKLTVLPQIVFRKDDPHLNMGKKGPYFYLGRKTGEFVEVISDDQEADFAPIIPFSYKFGKRYFYASPSAEPLFTNNESNNKLLFGKDNITPYVKDAFHRYIIHKEPDVINPAKEGTKVGLYEREVAVPPQGQVVLYFRWSSQAMDHPLVDVEAIIQKRKLEADKFYQVLAPKGASEDEKMIQRQAFSGMLWNKQFYYYDVARWIRGDDPSHPLPSSREDIRNKHWKHLVSMRILTMPDKWEYPWFAAWDLAFHTITLALVDMNFAKEQLWLLLFDQFQHPNGQIPAYEWEFSEMNPPVQAWAALRIFEMEFEKTGKRDTTFLKKCFNKLVINFVWWVNKVDTKGNNVFEGGFLGLDNITVIDRSVAIPGGGVLEQSDGTGWMGMFCLKLMRIALELAKEDPEYELMATKFFEHYVYIAAALHHCPNRKLQIWNEQEGFFYDVISYPSGAEQQILVRSLVGIIPLYAVDFITEEELSQFKEFAKSFKWFLSHRKHLVEHCITSVPEKKKYLLALLNKDRIGRVLEKVWDPNEFRSEYGLRSLSKIYANAPYMLLGKSINYEPAEAVAILKGGNSNWRGPIWFPTNFLLIDSLKKLHKELGSSFKIGTSGITAEQMAEYFSKALIKMFKKREDGTRPIFGDYGLLQHDPHFRDHLLFYEHFHGDTGRGLGASHQTGWSGLVANLIDEWLK